MNKRTFGGVEYTAQEVMTSQIKKGDIVESGNNTYKAYSNAYFDDVWSFDNDPKGMFVYGFRSQDIKVNVWRK